MINPNTKRVWDISITYELRLQLGVPRVFRCRFYDISWTAAIDCATDLMGAHAGCAFDPITKERQVFITHVDIRRASWLDENL